MMILSKNFLLIGLFFFTACGNTSGSASTEQNLETVSNINSVLKSENRDILQAINDARAVSRDCHDGLGVVGPSRELKWSDELYASAYEHSRDLAQSDTFSHLGSGTEFDITGDNKGGEQSKFFERIESNGYTNYYTVGENIAGGQKDIAEVMEAWLESPAHCTNIMNDKFEEVGVAIVVAEDTTFGIYWTQNFGAKF